LDLPDNRLTVLNTTRQDRAGLIATTRVVGLDGTELFTRTDRVDARANRATPLAPVPLAGLFAANPMVLVQLRLTDASGALVSDNFYWRGRNLDAHRSLNDLPQTPLGLRATTASEGEERVVTATLANEGRTPALAAKLTLVDEKGERILPAYYSDNYVSLLPGETRTVTIRYPATLKGAPTVRLRGWNVRPGDAAAR
jgi:hypothetical protein